MNISEIIKFLVGAALLGFGLLLLLGITINIGKDSLGASVVGIIMSLVSAGGGVMLMRNTQLASKKRKLQDVENMVLRIATANQGILTVPLLAMHANIPIKDAEKMLNTMQEQGLAQIQVDDNGTIFYEFTGLLR